MMRKLSSPRIGEYSLSLPWDKYVEMLLKELRLWGCRQRIPGGGERRLKKKEKKKFPCARLRLQEYVPCLSAGR